MQNGKRLGLQPFEILSEVQNLHVERYFHDSLESNGKLHRREDQTYQLTESKLKAFQMEMKQRFQKFIVKLEFYHRQKISCYMKLSICDQEISTKFYYNGFG